MLETQIAFAVLGVMLAGLCPFVVMQLRQLVRLESRLKASTYVYNSVGMATRTVQTNQIYYLVPWNNRWGRKLTARAQLGTANAILNDPPSPTSPTTHVKLPQPVLLEPDGDGNITATAVVEVN